MNYEIKSGRKRYSIFVKVGEQFQFVAVIGYPIALQEEGWTKLVDSDFFVCPDTQQSDRWLFVHAQTGLVLGVGDTRKTAIVNGVTELAKVTPAQFRAKVKTRQQRNGIPPVIGERA